MGEEVQVNSISLKELDRMMKLSYDFYDTIDFTKFINPGNNDLDDIISRIEEYYDIKNPNLLPEELKGYFFNYIADEEFIEYLKKRYGYAVSSVVIEKFYVIA